MAVILVFTSHMDGVCNIIFTLPRTSDYYVLNIVNIRIALSVTGEESICSHLRFWGFSIFSVSAKTEGSDDCADGKYLNVTIILAHRKFVNCCTFR